MTSILDPAATTFHPADNSSSSTFRNYTETNQFNERVRRTYYDMHTYQTVQFVKEQVSCCLCFFSVGTL